MMSASDVTMSLEGFEAYWKKNEGLISRASAYDAAGRRWIEGREIFQEHGVYTLIVVRFKNGHFLRVTVRPSLQVAYAPEKYRSAGFWVDRKIRLTYEEKTILEQIGEGAMTMEGIIRAVESSGMAGGETLGFPGGAKELLGDGGVVEAAVRGLEGRGGGRRLRRLRLGEIEVRRPLGGLRLGEVEVLHGTGLPGGASIRMPHCRIPATGL